jgi:hypothetical protein
LTETRFTDSLFAVASSGRYLYLAAGFDGIFIIDAGYRANPQPVGKVEHGVRYSQLLISDSILYAVDDFNGIDIYAIQAERLEYVTTMFTDQPIIDLAFSWPYLFAVLKDRRMLVFPHIVDFSPVDATPISFDWPLERVSPLNGELILAFSQGIVGLFDPDPPGVIDTLQLPYPVTGLSTETDAFAVVDAVGLARLLKVHGDELTLSASVELLGRPQSLAAFSSSLYTGAGLGGIAEYDFAKAEGLRQLRFTTGLVHTAMAVDQGILAAAANGVNTVSLYDLAGSNTAPIATWSKELPTRQLFLRADANGAAYEVICFGQQGAEGFLVDPPEIDPPAGWRIDNDKPFSAAFYGDEVLGLATADRRLLLYETPQSAQELTPELITEFTLSDTIKTMLYLENEYLLLNGDNGVTVNRLVAPYSGLDEIRRLNLLDDAIELHYDRIREDLIETTETDGVKYLDF